MPVLNRSADRFQRALDGERVTDQGLAETAKVLGKSEGAVKQLQLRAVRALHRELGDVEL